MNYKQYFDECASHDWSYNYSDDYGVWKRGSEKQAYLFSISKEDEKYKEIFDSWSKYAHQQPGQNIPRPEWDEENNFLRLEF